MSNPKILSGTPVIEGTRIPAALVFELLELGYDFGLIKKEYPSLSQQKLSAFFNLMADSFNVTPAKTL